MNLSDILKKPYTPEEYLAKKRSDNAEKFGRMTEKIVKRGEDPSYIDAVVKKAENCMKNLYVLPGTGGELFDVGTPPAWFECRTGDEEYTWGINRMPGFAPLTEAYLLTGDRKYADKAAADLLDWIEKCPPPGIEQTDAPYVRRHFAGVTPWRALEVGIRAFASWRTFYERLLMTEVMTPALHEAFVLSMYDHAAVMETMSPLLWPRADHNHYLHEMLGLLVITLMFPEIGKADAWREMALRELERCAVFQLTPEGGQVEGCPGYHNGCLGMFLTCLEIGKEYGIAFTETFTRLCELAANYTAWTIKPTGLMAAIGDTAISEGGAGVHAVAYFKTFGHFGQFEKMLPLIRQPRADDISPELYEEFAKKGAMAPGGCQYQKTLGQFIGRTGWTKEDSYFIFVCNTPVNNGHTHQDPMTFELTLGGDDIVIDPSYYTYRDGDKRRLYKSPEYHSCLTIGGKPPFAYTGMWSYSPQKYGHTEGTYSEGGLMGADAVHFNYEPDIHRRLAVLEGGDVFAVADDVHNETGSDIRLYFHMNDTELKLDGHLAQSSRVRVLLPPLEAEIVEATKAPHTDIEKPSQRIIVTDTAHGRNSLYLTLFTKRDDVSGAEISRTDDGILLRYKKGEGCVKVLWKFGEYCKRL